MAQPFADRFAAARKRFGPLVFGLDPSSEILRRWGLADTPEGLERFVDIAIEVAVGSVGLVKPQSAFYERHGWQGVRALSRLVAEARSEGLLVVLDVKRGDIGSTNHAYATAYMGADAPIQADAITVHPYLGLGAMTSLIERADESGSCLIVVVRSSNAEGRSLQCAVTESGASVEQALLGEIAAVNSRLAPGRIGPVGAVVAPLASAQPLELRSANALFLVPGLGAQGATPSEVASTFAECPERAMPSASRSLLEAGPEPASLREAVEKLACELARVGLGA
jgi:orotidine-5'-phosphate decarboxylase